MRKYFHNCTEMLNFSKIKGELEEMVKSQVEKSKDFNFAFFSNEKKKAHKNFGNYSTQSSKYTHSERKNTEDSDRSRKFSFLIQRIGIKEKSNLYNKASTLLKKSFANEHTNSNSKRFYTECSDSGFN